MDLGTAIVGLIVVLICVIPFVIFSIKRKRKEKRIIQSLNNIASEDGSTISQYEIWNDNIIGIDDNSTCIYAVCKLKEHVQVTAIHLSGIQRCRISKVSRNVFTNGVNATVIEKLELVFENKDNNKPNQTIEFYNVENNKSTLMGELQLIEKWYVKINAKIAAVKGK